MNTVVRARILVNLTPADAAWLLILAIVLIVDLSAPDESRTLSQRLNGYRPRWLWRAIVVATAGHLMRLWPPWLDFWSLAWLGHRWWRQHRIKP